MKDIVKVHWEKHRKIIMYLLCSITSALVESGIGWLLLSYFSSHIVVTNTIAVILGAVIHYFLTLKIVFKNKNNLYSILIYYTTFVLGIFLQNGIIWFLFDIMFANFPEVIRYIASKACSLAFPFFAIYYVRSNLNERVLRKETHNV